MKRMLMIVVALGLVLGSFSSAVAQRKREITVISREESSGTRGAFDELMNITDGKTNQLFREAVIVSSTDEAASKVEVDRWAIGYTSLGSVTNKIKALQIDGVVPNEANVKNGSYKIARPFVFGVKTGSTNQLANDFLKFVVSKQGQAVVARGGYITVDAAGDYTPAKLTGKITLSGSTSVERVVQRLKEEYEKLNPGASLEINYNGSSAGIRDCLTDKSHIAMSSRALKDDEKAQLAGTTFALDGIAVIVNRQNTLNGMKAETVTKIFKGETRHWEDAK